MAEVNLFSPALQRKRRIDPSRLIGHPVANGGTDSANAGWIDFCLVGAGDGGQTPDDKKGAMALPQHFHFSGVAPFDPELDSIQK